jgi:hypothetical protein
MLQFVYSRVARSSDFLYLVAHAPADINQQNEIEWLFVPGEDGDWLFLTLVEDSEVAFVQACDDSAIFVQNFCVNVNE